MAVLYAGFRGDTRSFGFLAVALEEIAVAQSIDADLRRYTLHPFAYRTLGSASD